MTGRNSKNWVKSDNGRATIITVSIGYEIKGRGLPSSETHDFISYQTVFQQKTNRITARHHHSSFSPIYISTAVNIISPRQSARQFEVSHFERDLAS